MISGVCFEQPKHSATMAFNVSPLQTQYGSASATLSLHINSMQDYVRAVPSRRPDIFPDLKEPKQPMPKPMPGDPEMPDEEEEEEERKKNPGEPGADPDKEDEENPTPKKKDNEEEDE